MSWGKKESALLLAGLFVMIVIIGTVVKLNSNSNEPLVNMVFVSGTEYNVGEQGQVIVEARFLNGSSAINGACNLTVWYPDKSVYLSVPSISSASGAEYTGFVIPGTCP